MDLRFQHVLLTTKAITLTALCLLSSSVFSAEKDSDSNGMSNINNEVFELGVFAGIVNIEDFTSELAPGLSATFRASEDYFIQYNYLQADASLSSFEKNRAGAVLGGPNKTFVHYDLLVGYNLFRGEFFTSSTKAGLSALYLFAGVGNSEFGGESNFTYTLGVGYEVAFSRHFALHFDFRNYIYESSLVLDKEQSVNATQILTGIKYSF
jgi:outer membrane beta-barrel protein